MSENGTDIACRYEKMNMHILAIDDDSSFLLFLKANLRNTYKFSSARNATEAEILIRANGIDIVLLDIGLGEENGLELLKRIKQNCHSVDVVMVTGQKDPKFVMEAVKLGAADYLVKPFEIEELIAVIEKVRPIRDLREKQAALFADINELSGKSSMLGESPVFKDMLSKANRVKGHSANILIEGESGTGKELLARYIHRLEENSNRPFIAVNCAAIPENLLESELFGHEKGSFTGAHQRKIGKFELANGGDVFLDEVSCLKWDIQPKILRVLQEREMCRIGGNEPIKVDCRVIAATNENLEKLVEEGKFRLDLFHRLRVVPFTIPSLNQRKGDIPLIAKAFLSKFSPKERWSFEMAAMQALQDYYWPGNIRELENLVQSLIVLATGPEIKFSELPKWVFRKRNPETVKHFEHMDLPSNTTEIIPLKECATKAEMAYVKRVLELTHGDKSKAATLLNISRSSLHERLRMWGAGS
ncbi:MAG: sigma-54-dependent Fis family transcriptional regulator [Deltaproteobacteria bacterium]|nr:sigma-54-dependent Fis family transcriptional regulator [Deltaproteobacteria bacterium]